MPNTLFKVALSLCTALSVVFVPVSAMAAGKQSDKVTKSVIEKPASENTEADKQVPPPSMDTDKDGKPDEWDRDANGTPDAWDINGDGQPDKVDNNGDGSPDDDKASSEPTLPAPNPAESPR